MDFSFRNNTNLMWFLSHPWEDADAFQNAYQKLSEQDKIKLGEMIDNRDIPQMAPYGDVDLFALMEKYNLELVPEPPQVGNSRGISLGNLVKDIIATPLKHPYVTIPFSALGYQVWNNMGLELSDLLHLHQLPQQNLLTLGIFGGGMALNYLLLEIGETLVENTIRNEPGDHPKFELFYNAKSKYNDAMNWATDKFIDVTKYAARMTGKLINEVVIKHPIESLVGAVGTASYLALIQDQLSSMNSVEDYAALVGASAIAFGGGYFGKHVFDAARNTIGFHTLPRKALSLGLLTLILTGGVHAATTVTDTAGTDPYQTTKTGVSTVSNTIRRNLFSRQYISEIFTDTVQDWNGSIGKWADIYNLDPNLVATIMQIGSCGNPAQETGLFNVYLGNFAENESQYDPDTNAEKSLSTLKALLNEAGSLELAVAAYHGGRDVLTTPEEEWSEQTKAYQALVMGIYNQAVTGQGNALQDWLDNGGAAQCNFPMTRSLDNEHPDIPSSHLEYIDLVNMANLGTYYNPLREDPIDPVTNCWPPCDQTRRGDYISSLSRFTQEEIEEMYDNPEKYADLYRPIGDFWFNSHTRTAGIAAPEKFSQGTLIWTPANNMLYAVIDTGGKIIEETVNGITRYRYDVLNDDQHTLQHGRPGATYDTPKLWVKFQNGNFYLMPATGYHNGVVVREGWDGAMLGGLPDDVYWRADNILSSGNRLLSPEAAVQWMQEHPPQ